MVMITWQVGWVIINVIIVFDVGCVIVVFRAAFVQWHASH